jgi:hypothetical protein
LHHSYSSYLGSRKELFANPGSLHQHGHQVMDPRYLDLYLGISRAGPGSGRAKGKPDTGICYPGPARPGCRASFFCPSPARRAKIVSGRVGLSGRRAGPSLISRFSLPKPGPARLSGLIFLPKPGPIACFGPTGRAIFGPGRAGPVGPGFPCPGMFPGVGTLP